MKRLATILMVVWGITIVYWQETQKGWVYINDTAYDAMFVLSEQANTCRVISDEPYVPKVITADDFVRRLINQNPGPLDVKSLITPYTMPAPPK